GAESLDERVGAADEAQHQRDALRVLEINGDGVAAAMEDLEARVARDAEAARLLAVDAQHFGAEIGQEHRRHGRRADPGHLDDLVARERSHRSPNPVAATLSHAMRAKPALSVVREQKPRNPVSFALPAGPPRSPLLKTCPIGAWRFDHAI